MTGMMDSSLAMVYLGIFIYNTIKILEPGSKNMWSQRGTLFPDKGWMSEYATTDMMTKMLEKYTHIISD